MGLLQWLAPGSVQVSRSRRCETASSQALLRIHGGAIPFFNCPYVAYQETKRQA